MPQITEVTVTAVRTLSDPRRPGSSLHIKAQLRAAIAEVEDADAAILRLQEKAELLVKALSADPEEQNFEGRLAEDQLLMKWR